MYNDPILHITSAAAWTAAQAAGAYHSDTLDSEGFTHCSTPAQVVATANRYYTGRSDLLLLVIDPARVAVPLRWEAARNGDLYPHIYGPLNPDAVLRAVPWEPGVDGRFGDPGGDESVV